MTNADWLRMTIPLADLYNTVTMDDSCSNCMAKKLCEEEYPDGVSNGECLDTVDKWLKTERNYEDNG